MIFFRLFQALYAWTEPSDISYYLHGSIVSDRIEYIAGMDAYSMPCWLYLPDYGNIYASMGPYKQVRMTTNLLDHVWHRRERLVK